MENNKSKILNETLDSKINWDLNEKLENLKALWLDISLFGDFKDRIDNILTQYPEAKDIVSSEVDKATLWVEQMMADYNDKFRTILIAGSENEDYIEWNFTSQKDVLSQFKEEQSSNDDDFSQDFKKAA